MGAKEKGYPTPSTGQDWTGKFPAKIVQFGLQSSTGTQHLRYQDASYFFVYYFLSFLCCVQFSVLQYD